MSESPAHQLGGLAARMMEHLPDNAELLGAIVIVAATDPEVPDDYITRWMVPEGQNYIFTQGLISGWQTEQHALITASAVKLSDDEDDN